MKIREYLENNFENLKSDLSRLVKIPSVSGSPEGNYPFGKECGKALDEFLKIAEEKGFTVRNCGYYAGSADLYPEGEAELGILAHLDVVPVTEKNWSVPPFELTEREGRLYGRGAEDDKGPLLAAMWAMKAVKECGFKLKGNVRLIAGCSEETGSELDIEEYRKREKMPEKVFTPDAEFPIITTEKGMLRFTFGGGVNTDTIIGIKGGTVVNCHCMQGKIRTRFNSPTGRKRLYQAACVSYERRGADGRGQTACRGLIKAVSRRRNRCKSP